jgi:V/A-type H+-transporting ATPase subunit D
VSTVSELARIPAGRAGRLWLKRRLDVARRGVELLDHQLRLLRLEQQRLRLLAEETGKTWRDRCREAELWLLRGAIVGGEREIRLATGTEVARLEITFNTVMGVRYPAEASIALPEPSPHARQPGNAGLVLAVAAYRAALAAAARHAVADTARRIVDAEVAEVQRRKRAIEDRWVPRLEVALRDLTQRLEDEERDELVRLHWVAGRRGGTDR